MRAMVLAAGLGTRLLPLTRSRPKCLMPIFNKPLLSLWLERLAMAGVEKTVVNTHYLARQVADFLSGDNSFGLKIQQSHEPEILGTAGGPKKALPLLGNEPFFMVNCDVLSPFDLNKLVGSRKLDSCLAVLGVVDDQRFNTVALDKMGRILGFKGDSDIPDTAVWRTFSGISRLSPELFELLPDNGYSSLVFLLKQAIAKGHELRAVDLNCFWDDLGTWERYLRLHHILANNNAPGELDYLRPEQALTMASDVIIENKAQVKGFAVLGKQVVVENNAVVKNSVLLKGARVKAHTVVENCVLGDGFYAQTDLTGGAYA